MNTSKKDRLMQAINHLRNSGLAHTQRDIAAKMGKQPSNVSSAINGNEKFLTDGFLMSFNNAYNNIFNYTWLTTGEGEMLNVLVKTSTHSHSPDNNVYNSIGQDMVKHIMDMNSSLIEQNKNLIEQNHYIIERIRVRNDQLFDLLNSLKEETETKFNNLNIDRENKLKDIIAQCSTVSIDDIIDRINKN